MRTILLLFIFAVSAWGSPFLVCDPYQTAGVDPSLIPALFTITGLGATPVTSTAFQQQDGTMILHYDLAALAKGSYTVTVSAMNQFGGSSPDGAPFHFVIGVPSTPVNIRISPT